MKTRSIIASATAYCALCFAGTACAQEVEQAASRFEIEIGHERIDGPGFRYRGFDDVDRQIDAIESGEQTYLEGRWRPNRSWYVRGRYERAELEYENPLTLICPALVVAVPVAGCVTVTALPLRDGFIHDDLDHGQIGIGFRHTFARWLSGFAELGYGRMTWDSSEDIEATAATGCQTFADRVIGVTYPYFGPRVDIPGCNRVSSNASADGVVAALGAQLDLGGGFGLSAAWHHQGYRHVIYRNHVLPRFNDANEGLCEIPLGDEIDCVSSQVLFRQPNGSWSWFQARLSYDFGEHWGVFVDASGGGNHTWKTYGAGLRVAF